MEYGPLACSLSLPEAVIFLTILPPFCTGKQLFPEEENEMWSGSSPLGFDYEEPNLCTNDLGTD